MLQLKWCFRLWCCTVRLYILGWRQPGLTRWILVMNHAPVAGSIVRHVDLQSSMPPLCYRRPHTSTLELLLLSFIPKISLITKVYCTTRKKWRSSKCGYSTILPMQYCILYSTANTEERLQQYSPCVCDWCLFPGDWTNIYNQCSHREMRSNTSYLCTGKDQ